jgi:hypothetical protein
MTESLLSLNESSCGADRAKLVEVVVTEFSRGIGFEHLNGDSQDFVPTGDDCVAPSSPPFHTVKEGPQAPFFAVRRGPCGLSQNPPQSGPVHASIPFDA